MEPFITPAHLSTIGIEVPEAELQPLLTELNAKLEERIGEEVTDSLDDEKLEELVKLQDTADEETLSTWIQANVEDLDEIVQQEIDIILGELAEKADTLNEETK